MFSLFLIDDASPAIWKVKQEGQFTEEQTLGASSHAVLTVVLKLQMGIWDTEEANTDPNSDTSPGFQMPNPSYIAGSSGCPAHVFRN